MKRPALALAMFSVFAIVAAFDCHEAVATSPYWEDFDTTANWSTASAFTSPTLVPSGGPDGSSYVSRTANTAGLPDPPPSTPLILFRAQDTFNSSGNTFTGNWWASGLNTLHVDVRHTSPVALPYFARFTKPGGGPGVNFELASLVPGNAGWQHLEFLISPSSPYYTPEDSDPNYFTNIMTDVGRLQIGFTVPTGFGALPGGYTYDMDNVLWTIPEPTTLLLSMLGVAACGCVRRKRSNNS